MKPHKPTPSKVKWLVLQAGYTLIIIISFLDMIITQNGSGVSAFIFISCVAVLVIIFLIKGVIWIIKNWNKEITL